ncbi:uncharacterized protein SPPG_09241 [Spizellomyces punctatus DAOM BR117]|uniref:Major facilitator superfamily (MFS) profile domain-containing protein n=1 Tax=Spizellomyces punctatus (strain DAOM BR117) TaxID=645134 RepID=A0A0L0HF41_SPIPD|nr:uncharacterized protein SPPG_09241 [Spizellomyces punctatus DAOM BR117]KNC99651.1 hypothetical protein SPPG_09241 [Spizellomyces punctatus DAOM BR117]|eukprot:XP_016607691.1 hypothetical protein SPPG_09241 [Spizellomyces punctatus DAOM BR117]
MLGEVTDNSNRGRAFSLLGLSMGIGSICGPMVGGLLSQPALTFPSWFDTPFWREYPFLLPCLVSAAVSTIGFTIGYFNLKETLIRNKNGPEVCDNENSPLLPHANRSNARRPALTRLTLLSLYAFASWAFQQIIFDETYPLYASTSLGRGGLGFQSKDIGVSLSMLGILTLFIQIFIYPRLERKYGALYLYRAALLGLIPAFVAVPFVNAIAKARGSERGRTEDGQIDWLVWGALMSCLGWRIFFNVVSFTSVTILVNNSVTDPANLGTVNGVGQCAAAGVRTIGPALAGAIWSWSLSSSLPLKHHLVYHILVVLVLVQFVEALFVIDGKGLSAFETESVPESSFSDSECSIEIEG